MDERLARHRLLFRAVPPVESWQNSTVIEMIGRAFGRPPERASQRLTRRDHMAIYRLTSSRDFGPFSPALRHLRSARGVAGQKRSMPCSDRPVPCPLADPRRVVRARCKSPSEKFARHFMSLAVSRCEELVHRRCRASSVNQRRSRCRCQAHLRSADDRLRLCRRACPMRCIGPRSAPRRWSIVGR